MDTISLSRTVLEIIDFKDFRVWPWPWTSKGHLGSTKIYTIRKPIYDFLFDFYGHHLFISISLSLFFHSTKPGCSPPILTISFPHWHPLAFPFWTLPVLLVMVVVLLSFINHSSKSNHSVLEIFLLLSLLNLWQLHLLLATMKLSFLISIVLHLLKYIPFLTNSKTFHLKQHIHFPTHDLLITRTSSDIITHLSHHESYQSDHKSFTFKFFSHIRPTTQRSVIKYRSFKSIDIDNFKSDILSLLLFPRIQLLILLIYLNSSPQPSIPYSTSMPHSNQKLLSLDPIHHGLIPKFLRL